MEIKSHTSSQQFPIASTNLISGEGKAKGTYGNKNLSEVLEQFNKEQLKEQKEQHSVSIKTIEEKVEGMNKLLDSHATSLKFNVHEKLERVYVQVVHKETEELVREIPPEAFLDMVATMLEQFGLLIDKRV